MANRCRDTITCMEGDPEAAEAKPVPQSALTPLLAPQVQHVSFSHAAAASAQSLASLVPQELTLMEASECLTPVEFSSVPLLLVDS